MKQAQRGRLRRDDLSPVVKYGMVQGGDPLTKDPAKRALYGTGGLNAVKAEARAPKMTRGSVAAVIVPGQARQRRRAVLHRRSPISRRSTASTPCSATCRTAWRCCRRFPRRRSTTKGWRPSASRSGTSRFATRRAGAVRRPRRPQELAAYRAVLDTSAGPITIEFFTDKAPDTRPPVPAAGGRPASTTAWRSIASRQGSSFRPARCRAAPAPLTEKQQKLVHNLPPEFNDTKHVKGIVSMARGDDPGSATTSFFICTGTSTALDGQYTAFGRVVDGMAAVEAIEASPRNGETPMARIELKTVRVEQETGRAESVEAQRWRRPLTLESGLTRTRRPRDTPPGCDRPARCGGRRRPRVRRGRRGSGRRGRRRR